MRIALAGIFVILLGIATALAIPRNAGDEYRLDIAWIHPGDDPSGQSPADMQSPDIASGPGSFLIFDRTDWSNRLAVTRDAVSVESAVAYINQGDHDPWQVRLLQSGRVVSVESSGIPRLYGSVLGRFQAQRISFQALPDGVAHTIPNDGTLTTVDAAPIFADGRSGMVVITGDIFGMITGAVLTADGAGDAEFVLPPRSQLFQEAVPTVYTVAILDASPQTVRFLTLRGYAPQRVDVLDWVTAAGQPPQVVMSFPVPMDQQRLSPPPVGMIDRDRVLLGLHGAVMLLDPVEERAEVIPTARDPQWLGGFSQGITGQIMIVADDEGVSVQLDDFSQNRYRSRSAIWSFPGAAAVYSGPPGWILERNGVFVAMDVVR